MDIFTFETISYHFAKKTISDGCSLTSSGTLNVIVSVLLIEILVQTWESFDHISSRFREVH